MGTEPSTRSQKVVIVGLGYVGLPLAQHVVTAGHEVSGYDRSSSVVNGLNGGRSHVDDIQDADVRVMLDLGFVATDQPEVLGSADVIVICVPTPLTSDGAPDLRAVKGAAHDIVARMKPGALVVLESTTFPGTTDGLLRDILETSGARAGKDFHLAFSPERVDPGNPDYNIANTPKVVGGTTPACGEAAGEFYRTFVSEVVPARGTREAETAKLLENTYRHINIALVNELAKVCYEMEIDIWDVIKCAGTKPFGFQAFYPGPGVGGHCIPIDPNYLSYAVREKLGHPLRFVELAQEINSSMPEYVARRAQDLLNAEGLPVRGSRILLVGVTYKPNIADERESPAVPLARRLTSMGADLAYFDPMVESWSPVGAEVKRIVDLSAVDDVVDLTILLQAHADLELEDVGRSAKTVLDTRGILADAVRL